jgi:hypothetical protein
LQLTAPSREFFLNNPGRRLPRDYKLFPGKMDHTTCLCIKIHPFARTLPDDSDNPTGPLDPAAATNSSQSDAPTAQ